jgi:hypothetical protein
VHTTPRTPCTAARMGQAAQQLNLACRAGGGAQAPVKPIQTRNLFSQLLPCCVCDLL